MKKVLAATAFSAFVVSGPLQHASVLPESAVGNASIAAVETVLNFIAGEAIACPGNGGGNGRGNGNGGGRGNGKGGWRR